MSNTMSNTMSDKPTVHFLGKANFHPAVREDGVDCEVAFVYAIDHPYLGTLDVRTSEVLKKFEDGGFETRNTIYVPYAEQ